jgi:catechol-2,3-dioxygenase
MARVRGLGHVGLYVKDLERELWFFRDLLGMQVTNGDVERGPVFLSAQPEEEDHEILLAHDPEKATSLQQLSFYCGSLGELKEFYRRFQEHEIPIHRIVTHGVAVGIYARDPEGNTVEVYWRTGVKWPQPFGQPIDLTRPDEEIVAALTTGMPAPAASPSG